MGLFLLHRLGHPELALYDASMAEWGRDETLPIERPLMPGLLVAFHHRRLMRGTEHRPSEGRGRAEDPRARALWTGRQASL